MKKTVTYANISPKMVNSRDIAGELEEDEEEEEEENYCLLFAGCLTSQQHASASQGGICSDNFTCCHIEIEVADPTFHLTQSQYTDTGSTSPSAGRVATGVPMTTKKIQTQAGFEPGTFRSRGGRLTTRGVRFYRFSGFYRFALFTVRKTGSF